MNGSRLALGIVVVVGLVYSWIAAGFRPPARDWVQEGRASWYGKWHAGKKTASGAPFDPKQYTAAHRRLPLGTQVRVTNLATDRSVIVTIT